MNMPTLLCLIKKYIIYVARFFFELVRFVEICIEKIMPDVWWRQSAAATRATHCHNLTTPRDEIVRSEVNTKRY